MTVLPGSSGRRPFIYRPASRFRRVAALDAVDETKTIMEPSRPAPAPPPEEKKPAGLCHNIIKVTGSTRWARVWERGPRFGSAVDAPGTFPRHSKKVLAHLSSRQRVVFNRFNEPFRGRRRPIGCLLPIRSGARTRVGGEAAKTIFSRGGLSSFRTLGSLFEGRSKIVPSLTL